MKKASIVVSILVLGTVLTGCSYNSNHSNNTGTKQSSTAKVTTSYYQNLNQADKKKIKFKFSKDKDETKTGPVGENFVISVKITNNSNKIVKFDKSKFLLFESEHHKITSSKTGIAEIKPGKSVDINQLLEDVGDQALVGNDSYFIYMNMDNKLAKTLTVIHMAKPQDDSGDSSEDSQQTQDADTSSDGSIAADQQGQSSNTDQVNNDESSVIITNAADAASLAAHSMGVSASLVKAIQVGSGYQIVSPDTLAGEIVSPDGSITYSDGNVISYDKLSQSTAKDPDGWRPSN